MKKRPVRSILLLALLAWLIVVFAFPIGTSAAEDYEIRKNGETLYVHPGYSHGYGGYTSNDRGMFAGVVYGAGSVYLAFYVRGDLDREWLYVPGRDKPVFYQRVRSIGE